MTPDPPHTAGVTALLVMVHGSPKPIANGDMLRVVDSIRNRAAYPIVEVGFLDCNEPDIPSAIARCAAAGATSIVAVPYFLHTGKHTADDLPTLLETAQDRYPGIEFRLGAYLGKAPQVTDILADRILATLKK